MNVIVTQNNSATEQVGSAVIEKLYQLATNGLDSSSNLVGRLHTTATYREYINMLTERFKDLYITADKYYIWFQDPVVRQKLLTITGDGVGISTDEAATAEIGTLFREDTNITSFNELKYFTRFCKNPSSYAFYKCSNLTSADLSNVETLSQSEFEQTNLSGEISMPLLNTANMGAFRSTNITKITNLGTITYIPEVFCYNCQNLTEVTIPEFCTRLDNFAFGTCPNLTTVNNLQYITSIGAYSFEECPLTSHTFSDLQNATSIGQRAFRKSSISGEINMPNLVNLGDNAFVECNNITKIRCLGKIQGILDGTFNVENWGNDSKLTEVYLPYECTMLGSNAFDEQRYISIFKQYDSSVDDWVDGQTPTSHNVLTSDKIESIGGGCFYGCSSLSGEVNLPNLLNLGQRAFQGTNITRITNLGKINKIPYGTFDSCSNLTSVIIPTTCKICENGCFGNTKISQFIFPYGYEEHNSTICTGDSAKYIRYMQFPETTTAIQMWDSFRDSPNDRLTPTIVVQATLPPDTYRKPSNTGGFGQGWGWARPGLARWYVPDSTLNAYKTHEDWSLFADSIFPISQLETDSPTNWALYQANKDYGKLNN